MSAGAPSASDAIGLSRASGLTPGGAGRGARLRATMRENGHKADTRTWRCGTPAHANIAERDALLGNR